MYWLYLLTKPMIKDLFVCQNVSILSMDYKGLKTLFWFIEVNKETLTIENVNGPVG